MTLARQERHKQGRYPAVNTTPAPPAPVCTCPLGWRMRMLLSRFDVATYGAHHWSGGDLDLTNGGVATYVARCPLFRAPNCRRVFLPVGESSAVALDEAERQSSARRTHIATCSRVGAFGRWCNEGGHVPGCPMYGSEAARGHVGDSAEVVGDTLTDSIR